MLALSGCGLGGAPSIPFLGTYFPAWMLAALVGVAAAILAKLLLVATGLEAAMPWQLGVCSAIGLIAAIAVRFLAFG
jgi:hypothetical protein